MFTIIYVSFRAYFLKTNNFKPFTHIFCTKYYFLLQSIFVDTAFASSDSFSDSFFQLSASSQSGIYGTFADTLNSAA
jgi:hypothetical protein